MAVQADFDLTGKVEFGCGKWTTGLGAGSVLAIRPTRRQSDPFGKARMELARPRRPTSFCEHILMCNRGYGHAD